MTLPPYHLTKPQIIALKSADRFGHFYADPRVGGRLVDLGFAKHAGYFNHGEFFLTEAGEAWTYEIPAVDFAAAAKAKRAGKQGGW